jgi:hypothetical protein
MQQRCPNCGSPVVPGQRFCGGCGAQMSLSCPQCRITVSPGTRFCPNCGATLGGMAPQQPRGMPSQQPGWGQQPGGVPQQPGWGQQPGYTPQPGYAPPAQSSQPSSSRRPLLVLLLFVLLIGLGVLAYFQTPLGTTIKGLFQSGTGGGSGIDITKPQIESVQVTASTTSATITWTTDEPASSQVEYGRDKEDTSLEPAQPDTDPSTGASAGVVTHAVILTGLEQSSPAGNIQYYYRVKSKDAAGNEAVSDWKTFETALSDT